MSKSNKLENIFLKLLYNATPSANLFDNAASSPLANIAIALHSADPGEAGLQSTSELAYTGYARVNVARTSGGFTVTNNIVQPVANIDFGQCTAGPTTANFFSTGGTFDGVASSILHRGPIGNFLGLFTSKADDVITIPSLAGVAVNDKIVFYEIGDALPAGMTGGVIYFVKTVSGNDITISTTQGGATLDLTTVGVGMAFQLTPIDIVVGTIPRLSTGMTIVEM